MTRTLKSYLTKSIAIGIILMIVLVGGSLSLFGYTFVNHGSTWPEIDNRFVISRILFWVITVLMCTYAIKIERQPFVMNNSLRGTFGFYLLSITGLVVASVIASLSSGLLLKLTGFSITGSKKYTLMVQLFHRHNYFLIAGVITAGVTEELLFRGYLLTRLQLLLKNNAMAVAISSLLFGIMHIGYGTVQNVVGPVFIGVVYSLYYIRYKNIAALMIAHALYDLMLISLSMQLSNHLKGG